MHTSPNHRLLLSLSISLSLSLSALSTLAVRGGRASALTIFLFLSAREGRQLSARSFLPRERKRNGRPAVKIINRKAYVVLSWVTFVCVCVRKRFDRGDHASRTQGGGQRQKKGVWVSGSLKEESVKSEEFWRVARNIGQRSSDKKKGVGPEPRFATEPEVYVCGSRWFHGVPYTRP